MVKRISDVDFPGRHGQALFGQPLFYSFSFNLRTICTVYRALETFMLLPRESGAVFFVELVVFDEALFGGLYRVEFY